MLSYVGAHNCTADPYADDGAYARIITDSYSFVLSFVIGSFLDNMEKSLQGSKVSLEEVLQQLCCHIRDTVINSEQSSFSDLAIETALLILRDEHMGAALVDKINRISYNNQEPE